MIDRMAGCGANSDEKKLAPANMVPLVDIEKHPGDVHFNTAGQLETGRLFAEGYLELVKKTDQE